MRDFIQVSSYAAFHKRLHFVLVIDVSIDEAATSPVPLNVLAPIHIDASAVLNDVDSSCATIARRKTVKTITEIQLHFISVLFP